MHATEMKTKRHYTSPVTCRATVELEGGFCSSIVPKGYVETSSHERYSVEGNFNVSDRGATEDAQKQWEINGWE